MAVRITQAGKFFRLDREKWHVKGFSYGPFAPNSQGQNFPERDRMLADFEHMRELGASSFRVYYPPSPQLLDDALDHGLRVFVDVPWEKHRCFFEDWDAQQRAIQRVRETAYSLGNHPGLFAISVGNEIPADIVRFYGQSRVARFVDQLIDVVKQEAPECLTTYVNFPTTEFLTPTACDFYCFNVYVHDQHKLGAYLDRLQHIAGDRPLILGEYGIDTIREGDVEQAEMLTKHLRQVFGHGLAGSFIFAYTDDWFTGGHQIDDWAFGVTRADRSEKVSAKVLQRVWPELPHGQDAEGFPLPQADTGLHTSQQTAFHPASGRVARDERGGPLHDANDGAVAAIPPPPAWTDVSVVVCSYNGAATLRECLDSLMELNYPNFEVILVDDGSTDTTREIANDFPQVVYHHQQNMGLSVARNVGAELANGEIVAYTDDDCVVDEDWLRYLVQSMQDQGVEAIGGPNITPASDGWVARCVAASPGNPSHVMFDDQYAEHVPGCNMAFHRETLLAIGGFDPQFLQAGDDVDVCWRLLTDGYRIGYAAGAMVWHHRRCTVRAYYQQQKGYGRAEAMLAFKHPQRFIGSGYPQFQGVIYGDGKAGLSLVPARVYHGRFGSALFQTIYQPRDYHLHGRTTSLEWHCASMLLLILATMVPPLALASVAMWVMTCYSITSTIRQERRPKNSPRWFHLLVFWLNLTQPIVRGLHRNGYCLRNKRLPRAVATDQEPASPARRISATQRELYWKTTGGQGRKELLDALVDRARHSGWPGDFYGGWVPWDIELFADLWHHVTVRTATEELGWPRRFTRARWAAQPTRVTLAAAVGISIWTIVAVSTHLPWALLTGLVCSVLLLGKLVQSRARCLRAAGRLINRAAEKAELTANFALESVVPEAVNAGIRLPIHIEQAAAAPRVGVYIDSDSSGA